MTAYEPTERVRAAARAATLADIARGRTLIVSAWSGRKRMHVAELLDIADLLDIVALSLYEGEPTRPGGICDSARLALADAEATAAETPGAGFPADFGQYVAHALDRRPLAVPARPGPTGWSHADEDAQLVAALDALHGHLDAAAAEPVALALLEGVFALHGKRAYLTQPFLRLTPPGSPHELRARGWGADADQLDPNP
ncbi:hypothetical protein ACWGS5_13695 [Streptomyces albidoflavus]|uniref:hypothetical protein n=1 Tax=Streptomyces sp. WAC00276 TaxID=2933778 RepID=UPI001FFF04DF|nr:hypothetical protein [Streptomyces sp. WAC00276]MCK2145327.1 hypothetical protein [Streptomyces sp. WAC00276]